MVFVTSDRRPDTPLLWVRRRWIREKLRQSRQPRFKARSFQVVLIHHLPSGRLEVVEMTSLEACVVIIAVARFVARFANPIPQAAYGLVACRPRQLHLVHCVLLAKQLPTMPAIDLSVGGPKSLTTHRIRTCILSR